MKHQRIVFCNCGGSFIDENIKSEILEILPDLNIEKVKLDDLCGLCATDKKSIEGLFSSSSNTLIVACHPRAVKLLLEYSGVKSFENLYYLDLRESDKDSALKRITELSEEGQNNQPLIEIAAKNEWPAWYPVLDYSRCTACGQCADFCLFGVYKKENGTVEVINPQGCKNNCPACARICPQVAIVFPKYQHGGAVSGTDVFDEDLEQKRQLNDMNQILGSDIYQALEQRKQKRQSIIKNEATLKAMEERNNALNEIK